MKANWETCWFFFFFFGLGLIEWIAGTVEDNCRQRKLVFWNELVN